MYINKDTGRKVADTYSELMDYYKRTYEENQPDCSLNDWIESDLDTIEVDDDGNEIER